MTIPSSSPDLSSFSRARKAAIVVQALMREGEVPPLADLPEEVQVALTHEIGKLKLVDRQTMDAIVNEFIEELEGLGLAPPSGFDATLSAMSAHLSPAAAARLRAEAASRAGSDPWSQVRSMKAEELIAPLTRESIEICAVILSRLAVDKAADALARLPGERARRIALAFARANHVTPLALQRIGHAIVRDYCASEAPAFDAPPDARVGAILNAAQPVTRDALLTGLDAADPNFAERVRKSIFTYAHVPARLSPRDVPKVMRRLSPDNLALVLAATLAEESEDGLSSRFLLENIPQRLAASLREQAEGVEAPKRAQLESAMQDLAATIRLMADQQEITFLTPDEKDLA